MNNIGNKGIYNLGNTCYMNSIIQCLIHLPQLKVNALRRELQNNNILTNKDLIHEWINIQNIIWSNNNTKVDLRNFLKIFINECNENKLYFETFNQNDASEFLILIIELLHKSLKRKITVTIEGEAKSEYDKLKLKNIESWKKFFLNNYSYIIENFYSESITFTSCNNCDYYTTNHEPIMLISLTLKDEYDDIYDSLNDYIDKKELDIDNKWKCDKCNTFNCPNQKTIFWDFKSIIIFQIKQYTINNKINKFIKYPLELDMSKYCINKKNNLIYDLYGICVQTGNLNSGHYYSKCFNYNDNQWYIYNDLDVKCISDNEILNDKPYCLFYIKRN